MLLSFKIDINKIETFITPILIIAGAYVVGKLLSILIRRYIRRSARILKTDPTNYSFVQNAVSMIVFIGAVLFVVWNIPQLHDLGKTLFAGAGILAAILGFASQEAFSNIISGIFLVIYKPFSVGDSIKLLSNGQSGTVEDITLRHTVIKGNENRRIVVPNSVISREQILNSSIRDERIKIYIEVLLTYKANHNRAMEIMREECLNHPLYIDGRSFMEKSDGADPLPVKIVALEDKGVRLRASVWTKNDASSGELKFGVFKSIKERFDAEGIEFGVANESAKE